MGYNHSIQVKVTDEQKKIIQTLIGVMGSTEAEVVRNIMITWLCIGSDSIMNEVIKEKWLKQDSRKTVDQNPKNTKGLNVV